MTRAAKYYIYRNLHTGGFSVKYRGKVVERLDQFTAHGVLFKVNETGRQRVLSKKQKNVHAYVVCDSYENVIKTDANVSDVSVTYDPYKYSTFIQVNNKEELSTTKTVVGANGKIYIRKPNDETNSETK